MDPYSLIKSVFERKEGIRDLIIPRAPETLEKRNKK